jgi:hypothetical protein
LREAPSNKKSDAAALLKEKDEIITQVMAEGMQFFLFDIALIKLFCYNVENTKLPVLSFEILPCDHFKN